MGGLAQESRNTYKLLESRHKAKGFEVPSAKAKWDCGIKVELVGRGNR